MNIKLLKMLSKKKKADADAGKAEKKAKATDDK